MDWKKCNRTYVKSFLCSILPCRLLYIFPVILVIPLVQTNAKACPRRLCFIKCADHMDGTLLMQPVTKIIKIILIAGCTFHWKRNILSTSRLPNESPVVIDMVSLHSCKISCIGSSGVGDQACLDGYVGKPIGLLLDS